MLNNLKYLYKKRVRIFFFFNAHILISKHACKWIALVTSKMIYLTGETDKEILNLLDKKMIIRVKLSFSFKVNHFPFYTLQPILRERLNFLIWLRSAMLIDNNQH